MSEINPGALTPGHAPRSRLAPILLAVCLLAAASLACSVGGSVGGSGAGATPTKTRRATFTPLPNALNTPSTASAAVRGALPPGVTAEAPGGTNGPAGEAGTPAAVALAGDTSLLIYATNTPTASPTPTRRPATATPIERTVAEPASARPTPYVVIKAETLNGRRGPGAQYERVGQAKQGQELFVLGRSADGAWIEVCCLANQPVWLAADQVDAKNGVELALVLTPPPIPSPTPTRPRVAAQRPAGTPAATAGPVGTPLPPFDIARGPEFPITRDNGVMTIWAKVFEGPADNQKPLGGYILKVFRDGVDISDNALSFGDRDFDSTGKFQGNYNYNLKFELNDASESDYEIYLARPGGFRVSPITKFTTKGTSYRTLVVYMAYWLAR